MTKIGEVIESASSSFTAQCYELHHAPPLGSLVKCQDGGGEIYGVVANVTTAGIEPGRQPIARGMESAESEDVYRDHPQLARLLRTLFSGLVLGYREEGQLRHYLPPRPPRLHSFVYLCEGSEVLEFGGCFDFLSLLLEARVPVPAEELIAAALRQLSLAQEDRRAFLVKAGKELTLLLAGDMHRLDTILRRIRA